MVTNIPLIKQSAEENQEILIFAEYVVCDLSSAASNWKQGKVSTIDWLLREITFALSSDYERRLLDTENGKYSCFKHDIKMKDTLEISPSDKCESAP